MIIKVKDKEIKDLNKSMLEMKQKLNSKRKKLNENLDYYDKLKSSNRQMQKLIVNLIATKCKHNK